MKSLFFVLSVLAISINLGHAVAITLGQTAGAARFFLSSGAAIPNTGTVAMGWMSNPADANSFIEFASAATKGNTVFTSGIATIAGNSTSASLESARGGNVFVKVTAGGESGIFRSSSLYPNDLTASGTTAGAASLSTDTWTVVTPALNWNFLPAGYTENTGALGLSDALANQTQRTGDKFTLGAPIPEAGSSTLGLLALGILINRRKR